MSSEYIKESTTKQIAGGHPEHKDYGYLWWVSKVNRFNCFYAGGFEVNIYM